MASRTPSRGRSSGGRSSSAGKSGPNPAVFLGIGVAIAASLVVVFLSGGKDKADKGTPAAAPVAEAPKAPAGPAPSKVKMGAAKAGKTPTKPAPELTADMLGKATALLDEAKVLCNDGVKARNEGDNKTARDKQSAAKDKIDAAKQSLQAQASWQEEADLSDWAQPAEYSALGNLWNQLSSLEKKVRMSGGT